MLSQIHKFTNRVVIVINQKETCALSRLEIYLVKHSFDRKSILFPLLVERRGQEKAFNVRVLAHLLMQSVIIDATNHRALLKLSPFSQNYWRHKLLDITERL